jgi:tetratricopeptide (TPR) repeat protein
LGGQGTRRALESLWLERAQRAKDASDQQIAALQKAFAIEPLNFKTSHAIGEAFRKQSWQGRESDYRELATQAMSWFQRGMKLNPYDDRNFLGCGLCLDWLGEHEKAKLYFDQANELEPNSYFVNAYMGWHYVQVEDYAAAKIWLERSYRLQWSNNPIALAYLRIAHERSLEKAASPGPFLPGR